MQNQAMDGAFGVEGLSAEMAMRIEGGGPLLPGLITPLVTYFINNAGQFVCGLSDGWNAYQQ
jgi:hypothetical protein